MFNFYFLPFTSRPPIVILMGLVLTVVTQPTSAYSAGADVLKAMSGTFSGSGFTLKNVKGEKQRVSCKLSNRYSKGSDKLTVSGKCASTLGSQIVKGGLTAKGNKVSGQFLTPSNFGRLKASSGSAKSRSIRMNATFVDRKSGENYKTAQLLELTKSGFKASFYYFDKSSKKYKAAGAIIFKKR